MRRYDRAKQCARRSSALFRAIVPPHQETSNNEISGGVRMSYYAVWGAATFLFLLLGLALWAKTRSIAFVVGLAFAYYWTVRRGRFVVYDLNGGNRGLL